MDEGHVLLWETRPLSVRLYEGLPQEDLFSKAKNNFMKCLLPINEIDQLNKTTLYDCSSDAS